MSVGLGVVNTSMCKSFDSSRWEFYGHLCIKAPTSAGLFNAWLKQNRIDVAGEGKPGTQVEGKEGLDGVVGTAEAWGTLRYRIMGDMVGLQY